MPHALGDALIKANHEYFFAFTWRYRDFIIRFAKNLLIVQSSAALSLRGAIKIISHEVLT